MEEYETIEHDMIHIKDYFKNYKFGIQERLSKLYFLNNMNTNKINDSTELLKSSKKRLVEIKNKGKECDKSIFELSSKIVDIDKEIENEKLNIKNSEEILYKKNIEYDELSKKGTLVQEYENMNLKYKSVCGEIENVLSRISVLKQDLESKKDYNIEELENHRNKLMSRTRRLSVIQYEKYVEDLYDFYTKIKNMVERIFRIQISTVSDNNKLTICVTKEDKNELRITIEDGKIDNIKGLGNELIEKYYRNVNDPRFVIFYFMFNK
jgi:predicted HAD superfamily phosphohydrolase